MSGSIITEAGTSDPTAAQVAQVRAFNRFYTNVIGVLHGMYLDTPFTLTEGRLLFEIARQPAVEVSDLRRALDIDAGYLSRVLSRFEAESLITRHRSAADARRLEIRIAEAGRAAAADLDRRSAGQIAALLRGADCDRLLGAMQVITTELGAPGEGDRPAREATGGAADRRVVTLRPPTLGDLGWVLHRHATVYAAEFGWDATFEELCARIIAEYTTLRDAHPDRAAGWIAEVDGAGRLGLLRARRRDHRAAPPAAGRAVGPRPRPRRHPRRAVPAVRPRGRLRRHHPVDLRPPGGRPQGVPGGRVHPRQRVPRRRVRPPHDEPDLVPPPADAIAVTYGQENRCNAR